MSSAKTIKDIVQTATRVRADRFKEAPLITERHTSARYLNSFPHEYITHRRYKCSAFRMPCQDAEERTSCFCITLQHLKNQFPTASNQEKHLRDSTGLLFHAPSSAFRGADIECALSRAAQGTGTQARLMSREV